MFIFYRILLVKWSIFSRIDELGAQMNNLPRKVLEQVHRQSRRQTIGPPLEVLRDALLQRHGPSVAAILYYGSCLRSGDPLDGLVDLYLIVDSYGPVNGNRLAALGNQLLPPNVFYAEFPYEDTMVRSKYAILSMAHLNSGTGKWFHSYIWGRFCQPIGVLYSRDEKVDQHIDRCLAQAVMTFVNRVLPVVDDCLTAEQLWQQGLAHSYRSELRTETPERARQLVESFRDYYLSLTEGVLPAWAWPVSIVDPRENPQRYCVAISGSVRFKGRLSWMVRRWQGKVLSILRLLKALFTFQGGVDYIAWKLQRHSGVEINLPDRVRKRPLVYGWSWVWKLYRQGVFR